MSFEDTNTFPLLVPIPCFDRHVVATGENDAKRRMHGQTSNIVRMSFECGDLLVCVVVEDAKLEVVGPSNEPILARNEAHTANRNLSNFKSFDYCASLMVVDVDTAVVKTRNEPGLGWVKVDSLDTVRPLEELPLQNGCQCSLNDKELGGSR